ncbi:trypsin-like serine protease with C-terminal PDZ domain [Mycolicibacterium chubuense NBB4]|uniref:Trypsin-like serine protease with C-terminal PDZ domain n=1 Tax=Mycolicibacterium chubuense (strain NBB4) TaxID=710421 RepID=I4BQK4_MYCCN|nr:trypsin-like peptidase domain-containing protein [Mycolicibacterium chubuense]AFM19561.1 trypsin-like serine protease with C-terminal PDZ domain [Mycolicibacterium chubuense NBB4]
MGMSIFRSLRVALTALAISLGVTLSLVAPAAPATAAPTDLIAVSASVEPAVVRIDTEVDYQGVVGAGTGFVIDPGGQVLTNFHVVQGADRITGTVNGRSYPATLVGYDRKRDVAVIQLLGAGGLLPAPIGDSNVLVPGQPVVALGNARGSDNPLTREVGTFTAFGRTINAEDTLTGSSDEVTGLIEFAAPVRAGDSGGPVINDAGQVVGMTTAASVNFKMGPAGQGFAIPINDAMGVANQIRSGARSDTVHIGPPVLLGVGVRASPSDQPGVLLHEVLRGGPAEQAGLVDGDVLLSVDGVRLDATNSLPAVLDRHYPGDVVDLTWIDNSGAVRTGKAVLTPGS